MGKRGSRTDEGFTYGKVGNYLAPQLGTQLCAGMKTIVDLPLK